MLQRILTALGLRSPQPKSPPTAIIEPQSDGELCVRATRGNLNAVQRELDAIACNKEGQRKGFFNKRWLLPNDALADVIAVLPQAQIDPNYREALERHTLSFAKEWAGASQAPSEFGITLYPFQEAAIQYLLRAKRVVLGDEAGVGKTFPAIAAAHRIKEGSVIVICPANLKLNWVSEIKRAPTIRSLCALAAPPKTRPAKIGSS